MEMVFITSIVGIVSFAIAFFLGYHWYQIKMRRSLEDSERRAKEIIEQARRDAQARRREAEIEVKDMLFRMRSEFEQETKRRREELNKLEQRLMQREENIDRRLDLLEAKERAVQQMERELVDREKGIREREQELAHLIEEEKTMLQRVSGMSQEQARALLLEKIEQELLEEKSKRLHQLEEEIQLTAEKKAKEVISLAIQKYAVEETIDSTVSVVSLPNDEMKGRIIGREGRNIRAFEMATGVDIIIDDTPEVVTISGFNPVRREIARIALQRLISDGRIHPARIEEVVKKAEKEVEENIIEEGEKAVFDAGVHGLHPELIKLIGRLKFRTSFGQNALQHSKEVAFIMGVMASELGLDFNLAHRIGLLHDIGKAVDHDVEGTHALIGAELARKYGEPEVVLNAIAAHHEEEPPKSIYAVLAAAADAISAARPGARRETIETYIKRLQKLEDIATSFKGVVKAYAIQAGREVRVIVDPGQIDDNTLPLLAYDIKKKIESEMEYPGQIKVVLIRESRAIEYAK